MGNFVVNSIIASVVLTLLLNLLPLLFPNFAANTMRKIEESARQKVEQQDDASRPNIKVFFPWKAMLIGSVILTVVVNLVRMFSG